MRILIDLQGAQSGSRFRGIGRYSLALALAIARNRGRHDLDILLNARFSESIQPIKDAFAGLLSDKNFHIWMPMRQGGLDDGDTRADELLREAFIAGLKPDVLHISSLIEGLSDPVITSIGRGGSKVLTAVTLYDLIPFIHQKPYLENPVLARWYFSKLAELRRADLLLGISASASKEAIDYIGFDQTRVVNISTATDDTFRRLEPGSVNVSELRVRYGLSQPFVMYTGGIDHRKNIEGLIRAFAKLPDNVRVSYQLAIVCAAQPEARLMLKALVQEVGLPDEAVQLTGFVPEDDLVALYNMTELFVFPSLHEGFGLPVLEAMLCGAPVIGSNTSSLPEVIGLDEAMFDPRDEGAISSKILQGLTDGEFRHRLLEHGAVQALKFSWDASARTAIEAMECLKLEQKSAATQAPPTKSRRLRLAYVSPLPPEKSGIADYSAELIPELSRHYDIDVIVAQDSIESMQVLGSAAIRSVDWFKSNGASYDRVLYHFGNSSFHAHMVDLLEAIPGLVVLHDFFLSGMFAYREFQLGHKGVWNRALYQSHGYAPIQSKALLKHDELIHEYPCNFGVLSSAINVIVHSQYSCRLANHWYGSSIARNWSVIPLMRTPVTVQAETRCAARARVGLPDDALLVCTFGFMAPTKMNRELLMAWLSVFSEEARAFLIFVGGADAGAYGADIEQVIIESGLGNRVRITGYVGMDTYRDYLDATDIAVQLRTNSRGETSAAVLDALNHQLPTIVNANGAMADLDPNAAHILPDRFSIEELSEALRNLSYDIAGRLRLGTAGRALIEQQHAPRRCAEQYAQAIESAYARSDSGSWALTEEIARQYRFHGLPAGETALGRSLSWAFPPSISGCQALVDVSGWDDLQMDNADALRRLMLEPVRDFRVEPIAWSDDIDDYVYARSFGLDLIGCPRDMLPNEPVDVRPGDIVLFAADAADTMQLKILQWRGAVLLDMGRWLSERVVRSAAANLN